MFIDINHSSSRFGFLILLNSMIFSEILSANIYVLYLGVFVCTKIRSSIPNHQNVLSEASPYPVFLAIFQNYFLLVAYSEIYGGL